MSAEEEYLAYKRGLWKVYAFCWIAITLFAVAIIMDLHSWIYTSIHAIFDVALVANLYSNIKLKKLSKKLN